MSLERNNISRASATVKWAVPNTTMAKSALTRAIIQEQWAVAIQLVRETPKLAHRWSQEEGLFDGKTTAHVLPLHEALIAKAPLEVIEALVKAYPKALMKAETSFQRLPLHCACKMNADPEVIKFLVDSNAQSGLQVDTLGRVPVHYALTNGANPATVQILLDTASLAAKSTDNRGWTPVHIAVSVNAHPEIVKELLIFNPNAVNMRTNKGTELKNCIAKDCSHQEEFKAMIAATQQEVGPLANFQELRNKSIRASGLILA